MNEAEEGKKLRRLAKDYSKGLLSEDMYRLKRADLIDAFMRFKADSFDQQLQVVSPSDDIPHQEYVILPADRDEAAPSMVSSLLTFLIAFFGGALLGFLVLSFNQWF